MQIMFDAFVGNSFSENVPKYGVLCKNDGLKYGVTFQKEYW